MSTTKDLPRERLQYDRAAVSTLCLGGLCKKGPWLAKALHAAQGLLLLVHGLLLLQGYCQGDLSRTRACEDFSSGCAYHKLRNCQYYHTHCSPDADALLGCFTDEGRGAMSGRMDIRLLGVDRCVRCAVLAADARNPLDEDEFQLLDEAARGTPAWRCDPSAHSCFHTRLWGSLACDCPGSLGGLLNASALAGLRAGCARGRRLAAAPHQYYYDY